MLLDNSSGKKRRGRPGVDPHLVLTTADVFRTQFSLAWPRLGTRLLAAQSPEGIMAILKRDGGMIGGLKDLDFSSLVFKIIHDPKFPKVRTKSQISFLADSLGAGGLVTPRRSREIFAEERKKVRHVIVRRDFYIACTCGYEGPALNGGCPKCGTAELSEELKQREDYEF